ncbi:DnaJ-domain-containing protein [Laetiporus sulphureus 93-53]|uniref:DnaJ-domain-containing protein n=1 Tax=Laetiporus sulphureus 93-53 TaxID=1314785 RepID=A0A165H6Y5_9APHY|nr:DnaJ-domain-containing protein [Laetiporus sulphureus 93-53]KZT11328.1 DnaJ-domain-containing protein [Laetiporus sulphureus 93-53]
MAHRYSTVLEAYSVLGLEQGSSLDIVKNAYKQLALKTHPDKNPDNEDATAQFQRLSEAYNVLIKHHDQSSSSPHRHAYTHSYSSYGHYNDDQYDDEYRDVYDDDDEDLAFYMFLYEQLMRGKGRWSANMRYQRYNPRNSETTEQLQARMRRVREEQEAMKERRANEDVLRKAELEKERKEREAMKERRAREDVLRKAKLEKEREQEKKAAEERQRLKTTHRKAQAAAFQKSAAKKARAEQERLQTLRSEVFSAARRGDGDKVRKGIYEDNVDATGGEIIAGSEAYARRIPEDRQETLMHIAAKNGDAKLVQWLDCHNADPEECDESGMTAFQVALQRGDTSVLKHFYTTYRPEDPDYKHIYSGSATRSLLSLALESHKPEAIRMILDKGFASEEDINEERAYVISTEGKEALCGTGTRNGDDKYDEILDILMSYGGFSAPAPSPISQRVLHSPNRIFKQFRQPPSKDSAAHAERLTQLSPESQNSFHILLANNISG